MDNETEEFKPPELFREIAPKSPKGVLQMPPGFVDEIALAVAATSISIAPSLVRTALGLSRAQASAIGGAMGGLFTCAALGIRFFSNQGPLRAQHELVEDRRLQDAGLYATDALNRGQPVTRAVDLLAKEFPNRLDQMAEEVVRRHEPLVPQIRQAFEEAMQESAARNAGGFNVASLFPPMAPEDLRAALGDTAPSSGLPPMGGGIVPQVDNLSAGIEAALVSPYADSVAAVENANENLYDSFYQLQLGLVGNSVIPDMVRGIGDWFDTLATRLGLPVDEMTGSVRGSFDRMGDAVATSIGNMVKTGESDLDSLRNTALSIIDDMRNMIIERTVTGPIRKGIGGILDFIIPRAAGGPVMPNQTFLVGERGPELFVPDTVGDIIPRGGFNPGGRSGGVEKGAVVINYNVDARGADPAAIRRLEANQKIFYNAMPKIAIASVMQHMARNPGF